MKFILSKIQHFLRKICFA